MKEEGEKEEHEQTDLHPRGEKSETGVNPYIREIVGDSGGAFEAVGECRS